LPEDSFGRSVRYGRDLIAHTSALIGPDAADASMRYSGNGLECQSCHLDAGTRRFGIPLAGLWAIFPTFVARENEVRTLEERINGCMERSMNGRALPEGGPEMKAMLAYVRYITERTTTGQPPSAPPPEAAPLFACPRPSPAICSTVLRFTRRNARSAISLTVWANAWSPRKRSRSGNSSSFRRYGARTATTMAPGWRAALPRRALS